MEQINYATKTYEKAKDCYRIRELDEAIGNARLSNPSAVSALVKRAFGHLDTNREHVLCLSLNAKNILKSIDIISVGTLDGTTSHPREVFYAAIANHAASIILVHNHGSGDPTPSQNDINNTKKIKESGNILGIPLIDHIIFGEERYTSFKEENLL